jgi:CheY-like chemotaxis protein
MMSRERVLIVDDEPMIRWMFGETLRDWGYEVAEAGSAAEALAEMVAVAPNAILLDINLPDGSGLDLLRDIKGVQPSAAVVMVTANAIYENALDALRGGADDFLGKPVNLDELHYILDRVIQEKQSDAIPPTISKPRVLIVSDKAERIPDLLSAFHPHDVEITSVVFPEEWGYASGDHYDLALIDVGPEMLEPLLRTIRGSAGHADIPVLVELSRSMRASQVAGVMPKYRAMACSREEMIHLVRRRIASLAPDVRKNA